MVRTLESYMSVHQSGTVLRDSSSVQTFGLYPTRGDILTMISTPAYANRNAFRIMLVFLVPPWAVYLDTGLSKAFWLNVLLTLLAVYPGVIHGVFVVLKHLR